MYVEAIFVQKSGEGARRRLRRRLCCRERNGRKRMVKIMRIALSPFQVSAGFDAISRVVNVRCAPIRSSRARMPGHWCGDAELCVGPRLQSRHHRGAAVSARKRKAHGSG
jgi:hypothetical protein